MYDVSIANNEISNLPSNANVLTLVASGSNWKLQYFESKISNTTTLSYTYSNRDCLSYYGYGNISYDEWTAIESSGVMFYNNNKYIGNPDGNFITVVNSTNTACKAYKKGASVITTNYYLTSVLTEGEIAANTTAKNIIITTGTVTVGEGVVLTMNENGFFRNGNAANFVFKDGAELIYTGEETVNATFEKDIIGYNSKGSDGWYFIANPTANTTVNLSGGNSYDLYTFNPAAAAEWHNEQYIDEVQIPEENIAISRETGYLYANATNFTLKFEGELIPSGEDQTIDLVYYEGVESGREFPGFNLIGNPFACNAYVGKPFYVIQGTELTLSENAYVAPCEGFFVEAAEDDLSVTLSTTVPAPASLLSLTVSQNRGNVIDRAIVRFDGANDLHKFMMNPDHTNIRLAKHGEEFAAISSEAEGEIPVSFKAEKNGSYTITVNTENVNAHYIHLIDNKTGMDVDLLATPSYTFNASTSDYAYRFKLVFSMTGVEENESNANSYAYINNGNLVIDHIEGEATMQIVDMLGRVVSTEIVSGSYNKALNLKAGLYIINLNGMTQKIVVK